MLMGGPKSIIRFLQSNSGVKEYEGAKVEVLKLIPQMIDRFQGETLPFRGQVKVSIHPPTCEEQETHANRGRQDAVNILINRETSSPIQKHAYEYLVYLVSISSQSDVRPPPLTNCFFPPFFSLLI